MWALGQYLRASGEDDEGRATMRTAEQIFRENGEQERADKVRAEISSPPRADQYSVGR
jgi:hypothetical protein